MKCCLTANAIPADAHGTITYQSASYTDADKQLVPETTQVKVLIAKGHSSRWYSGVVDANNYIKVTIQDDGYFSEKHDFLTMAAYRDSDNEPIVWADGDEYFDCIKLRFLPKLCVEDATDYNLGVKFEVGKDGGCGAKADPFTQYFNESRADTRYLKIADAYSAPEVELQIINRRPTKYIQDYLPSGYTSGADAQAAFQAAFDALNANGGGTLVLEENGLYGLSQFADMKRGGSNYFILEGNGAKLQALSDDMVILANPIANDAQANSNMLCETVISNLRLSGNGHSNVTGAQLYAQYNSEISKVDCEIMQIGFDVAWSLNSNIVLCKATNVTGTGILVRPGSEIWTGETQAFSAGNALSIYKYRVYQASGADAGVHIRNVDSISLDHCVFEGNNPVANIIYEDSSNQARSLLGRKLHLENHPSDCHIKIISEDALVTLDNIRNRQPNALVIDASQSTGTTKINVRGFDYLHSSSQFHAPTASTVRWNFSGNTPAIRDMVNRTSFWKNKVIGNYVYTSDDNGVLVSQRHARGDGGFKGSSNSYDVYPGHIYSVADGTLKQTNISKPDAAKNPWEQFILGGHVELGHYDLIESDFTISLWLDYYKPKRVNTAQIEHNIFNFMGSNGKAVRLDGKRLIFDGYMFDVGTKNDFFDLDQLDYLDGAFFHLLITKSGTDLKYYIDGTEYTPTSIASSGGVFFNNRLFFSRVEKHRPGISQWHRLSIFNTGMNQAQVDEFTSFSILPTAHSLNANLLRSYTNNAADTSDGSVIDDAGNGPAAYWVNRSEPFQLIGTAEDNTNGVQDPISGKNFRQELPTPSWYGKSEATYSIDLAESVRVYFLGLLVDHEIMNIWVRKTDAAGDIVFDSTGLTIQGSVDLSGAALNEFVKITATHIKKGGASTIILE